MDYQVGRDVAMQVASMNPVAVDRNSVAQSVIDGELSVAIEKTKEEQVKKAVEAAIRKPATTPTTSTARLTSNQTSRKAGSLRKMPTKCAPSSKKPPRPRLQTSPSR